LEGSLAVDDGSLCAPSPAIRTDRMEVVECVPSYCERIEVICLELIVVEENIYGNDSTQRGKA
jgi:hypothetical protein